MNRLSTLDGDRGSSLASQVNIASAGHDSPADRSEDFGEQEEGLAQVHPDAVYCKCSLEADPGELLVCEGCRDFIHLGCADPPLAEVP